MTAKRIAAALAALLVPFLLPTRAAATAQFPDRIILEGVNRELHLNPLEQWFAAGHERPAILETGLSSTALWRGYVATWEILDGTLYLVQVEQEVPMERANDGGSGRSFDTEWRAIPLGEFFPAGMIVEIDNRPLLPKPKDEEAEAQPEQPGDPKTPAPPPLATKPAVVASWYSGTLRLPDGEMLRYVHQGYASVFEREIQIEVNEGVVIRRETIDNREKPLVSDYDAAMKEVGNYTPGGGIDPDLAGRLEVEPGYAKREEGAVEAARADASAEKAPAPSEP